VWSPSGPGRFTSFKQPPVPLSINGWVGPKNRYEFFGEEKNRNVARNRTNILRKCRAGVIKIFSWGTTKYFAGVPQNILLGYHKIFCWGTTKYFAEVPQNILLGYHKTFCWGTTKYFAGVPQNILLGYHKIFCWGTTKYFAGVPQNQN